VAEAYGADARHCLVRKLRRDEIGDRRWAYIIASVTVV
jgi:hypothetical protein